MAASARYYIHARSIGYTPGAGVNGVGRLLRSGKLTSASATAASEIVIVPDAPAGCELDLYVFGVYGNATTKAGAGYAFLQIAPAGTDPVMVQTEKAVEDSARVLLEPPFANHLKTPGAEQVAISVQPGERFAIIDAGFAL